jgi:hypothetical protein
MSFCAGIFVGTFLIAPLLSWLGIALIMWDMDR